MRKGPESPAILSRPALGILTIRDLVFFVLGALSMAGLSADHFCGRDASASLPNKPAIADAVSGSAPDDGGTDACASYPAPKKKVVYVQVPILPLPSDDEILQRAQDIKEKRDRDSAQEIIDQLCVDNLGDRLMILGAVERGLTIFKSIQKKRRQWILTLNNPNGESAEGMTFSNQPSCIDGLVTGPDELDPPESEEVSRLADDNRIDEALQRFDLGRMESEAERQGVKEILNDLIFMMGRIQKELNSEQDSKARKLLFCQMLITLDRFEEGQKAMDPALLNKILSNPELGGRIDHFMEIFYDLASNDMSNMDVCLGLLLPVDQKSSR